MPYILKHKVLPKGISPLIRHVINRDGKLVTYRYYQAQIYKNGKTKKLGSFPHTPAGLNLAIEIYNKNQ